MTDKFIIYTDGAATMRKVDGQYVREAGGWAYAVLDENDKLMFDNYGHADNTTNNEMELNAIFQGLMRFNSFGCSGKTVEIRSDSAYCVNIFNEWIKGWKANGWTRGKKHEPIENVTLIKNIDWALSEATRRFNKVTFVKVKGHANDEWNNYVDKLAVDGKEGRWRKQEDDTMLSFGVVPPNPIPKSLRRENS